MFILVYTTHPRLKLTCRLRDDQMLYHKFVDWTFRHLSCWDVYALRGAVAASMAPALQHSEALFIGITWCWSPGTLLAGGDPPRDDMFDAHSVAKRTHASPACSYCIMPATAMKMTVWFLCARQIPRGEKTTYHWNHSFSDSDSQIKLRWCAFSPVA